MHRLRKSILLWCCALGVIALLVGCGSISTVGGGATPSTTATPGATQTVAYIDSLNSSTTLQVTDGSVVQNFTNSAHGLLSPIVNGRVYVAFDAEMVPESTVRTVWAVDAQSGAVLWSHPTGPGFSSAPVVGNGLVYVSSEQGEIFALDAQTGAQKWHHQVTVGPSSTLISEQVAVDTNSVYQLMPDHIYAYDAQNGTLRWTSTVGGNALAVAGNSVLVEHAQDAVYAFDATTGTQQWKQTASQSNSGPVTPLVVAGGSVYVTPDGMHILKLNLSDGSVQATITADAYVDSWTADADNLYVATLNSVRAYGLADSAVHWVAGLGQVLNVALASGMLLTLTWDGTSHATTGGVYITALRVGDGGQNWRTHVKGLAGYGLETGTIASTAAGATPTPGTALTAPTNCGPNFDTWDNAAYQHAPVYIAYYDPPQGTYPGIAFPPFTRTLGDNAAGIEGMDLCSAGTGASILAFMTTQFTNAGWHQVTNNMFCVFAACWQSPTAPNNNYVESWQIGTNNLWSMAHHNPHG